MKGKLFKKGVSAIVEQAVRKIEASKDTWAENTINGFRQDWAEWISLLEPGLRTVVSRLPAKTTDIRANVMNRVVPVAGYISGMSKTYKARKITAYTPVPPPAPVTR